DEDGLEILNAPVSFSSEAESVATVDAAGVAHAFRAGATKISASSGDATAHSSLAAYPLTLVINEVLADPPAGAAGDANRDGTRSASQDEFVEIVNAAGVDLDLGGCQLATLDAANTRTARHVFAAGTLLLPGTAAVVFGGANAATFNPLDAAFGGALVLTASSGGLSLLNGGDTVQLLDPGGALIEEVTYGGESALAGDRHQSLTRAPDILGDFALHSSLEGASSRLFSPGTRMDGSPFATTAPIARIEISPASATVQPGESRQFTAHAYDGAGQELPGVIFRWQARDPSVASVGQDGTARALKDPGDQPRRDAATRRARLRPRRSARRRRDLHMALAQHFRRHG
ncbi:MAG: lamin tail domain-containing protein, partial [Acidobacteria bacterium]|nr:lamin tail domain-containing protein [Acidobacteriota bacterium]